MSLLKKNINNLLEEHYAAAIISSCSMPLCIEATLALKPVLLLSRHFHLVKFLRLNISAALRLTDWHSLIVAPPTRNQGLVQSDKTKHTCRGEVKQQPSTHGFYLSTFYLTFYIFIYPQQVWTARKCWKLVSPHSTECTVRMHDTKRLQTGPLGRIVAAHLKR